VRAGGITPFANTPSRVVAVQGILAFWKASLFAGSRRNEGLGRSVVLQWVSSRYGRRADDSGCPEGAEEGNVVAHAHRAYAPDAGTRDRACARQTRPSLGPSTRARQSSLHTGRQKRLRGGATAPASRLGKPTQVGRTSTGVGRADEARLAACHRFRKGEAWHVREKEGGRGLLPCEDRESRLVLLARRVQLQKSTGDIWPRISSANALQKGRSGSSERGPSSEWRSAGETVGRRIERRDSRESASPLKTGEVRRKTQGGARASSSGCDIVKNGGVLVGPGL